MLKIPCTLVCDVCKKEAAGTVEMSASGTLPGVQERAARPSARRRKDSDVTKTERIAKLLKFLDAHTFEAPRPLPPEVYEALYKRMEKPSVLREADVISVTLALPLSSIVVFTAMESHHNGDLYGKHREQLPVFDEFLDFACSVLANRAFNKVSAQMKVEEQQEHDRRVRLRLLDMGFID